jgi:hypothetical protein
MSELGMQLPGGQLHRGASMNVYTGLLLMAVAALAVAAVFVWVNASQVGKTGDPFGLQTANQIQLKQK